MLVSNLLREPAELHATAPTVHDATTDAAAKPRHAPATVAANRPE